MDSGRRSVRTSLTPGAAAQRCRRKFLRYFPRGFRDDTFLAWERDYKWAAHRRWRRDLGPDVLTRLIAAEDYREIAARAVRIESGTNLLFSFEKMALRDAVRTPMGAMRFARGLYAYLHGAGRPSARFTEWCAVVAALPRRQTRVLTWPVATVFGFIAQPTRHMFLKPAVTRRAAAAYGVDFDYTSAPSWPTYASLLAFARRVRRDQQDLGPRDFIDAQSFIWVQGSEEY
jgi:hypothetical protein